MSKARECSSAEKVRRTFLGSILACMPLSAAGYAAEPKLEDFWSDGCTLFPDGTLNNRSLWCDCCFNHDLAYWRGGTEEARKQADKALHACVLARTGNKALADTMYDGVRLGGSPAFPTWYRWGYGWGYGRGYQALTEDEQKLVGQTLARYYKTHPYGYCRKLP